MAALGSNMLSPGSGLPFALRSAGVDLLSVDSISVAGLERHMLEFHWATEPGSVALRFDRPAVFVVIEETGGRCQVRVAADLPPEQGFFGNGHASYLPAGFETHLHARELRFARVAVLLLDLKLISILSTGEQKQLRQSPPRIMFFDEPLFQAARLVVEDDRPAEGNVYTRAIARTFVAALGRALSARPACPSRRGLDGQRLDSAVRHLLDYSDSGISVPELAKFVGIPTDLFASEFKRMTGMTVKSWQLDARVRMAQRLMLDPAVTSLLEVAELAGFSDQSHMSRSFQNVMGKTPTTWLRERH